MKRLSGVSLGEMGKAPACAGAFSDLWFDYTGLGKLKRQLFLDAKCLVGLELLVLWRVWGLDMRFC
jgi:hypothetical protein